MNIDDLTNLEDLKRDWEYYLEETRKVEYEVFEERNKRIIEYLEKAKNEFKEYFKQNNKFNLVENYNRFYVSYNELKFEIFFEEPNRCDIYEFSFSIIKAPRVNYHIPIVPFEDLKFPKLSAIRTEPNSIDLYKKDIERMQDEFVHWQEIIEKIRRIDFNYLCYSAENSKPGYKRMKKYKSFTDLMKDKILED